LGTTSIFANWTSLRAKSASPQLFSLPLLFITKLK
jgi:hypothetical protein